MTEKTKLILRLVEDKRITVDEAGILLEPEPQPLQWYPYYPTYHPTIYPFTGGVTNDFNGLFSTCTTMPEA